MLEFSLAETLMVELAIKSFMEKDMCTLDRHVCEQAYMKVNISKKGQQVSEAIKKTIVPSVDAKWMARRTEPMEEL